MALKSPYGERSIKYVLYCINTPEGHWNLGRVLETYPGPDGLIRTVKVKTKDAVYVRPIKRLCLLENDVKEVVDTM